MNPTLGRIVHFNVSTEVASKLNQLGGKRYNISEKIPGMIVRIHDNGACNLTLFPDADENLRVANVPYSTGSQPGTWNWPERIAETTEAAA
jgi:hypothetical protein